MLRDERNEKYTRTVAQRFGAKLIFHETYSKKTLKHKNQDENPTRSVRAEDLKPS